MSDVVSDRMMYDHLEQVAARQDEAAYLRCQVQLLTDEVQRLRLTNDTKEQRDRRLSEITADMPRWKNLTLLQKLRDGGAAMKCVPMFAVKAMRHAASMIESYQQHDAELESACEQSELDYQAEIQRLRLTQAELEAIAWASKTLCVGWHDLAPEDKQRTRDAAATLRGLLERMA